MSEINIYVYIYIYYHFLTIKIISILFYFQNYIKNYSNELINIEIYIGKEYQIIGMTSVLFVVVVLGVLIYYVTSSSTPSESTTQKPASESTTQKPASESTTQKPASESTTQKPASESTTQKPASEQITPSCQLIRPYDRIRNSCFDNTYKVCPQNNTEDWYYTADNNCVSSNSIPTEPIYYDT